MMHHEISLNELKERQCIRVQGMVQGIGFRPFVYTLAKELELSGFVGNDSHGVLIEVEGDAAQIDRFIQRMRSSPPPLAHIEQISTTSLPLTQTTGFHIAESRTEAAAATIISPDLCICDDCLRELFDPRNRRYGYPFINCTNCGPRFTITKEIPYDRALTTMAPFVMCMDCQAEYDNPRDRRFHAQPNACAACGPQLQFRSMAHQAAAIADPIWAVQNALQAGGIAAIKGLGGFHLACDATNPQAVRTLRMRKNRAAKPFAIMVANIDSARQVAHLNDQEEMLLRSRERPILLLQKRAANRLCEEVAPGNGNIGIMLPYTPLHYLLFENLLFETNERKPLYQYLVMTSGNLSNEPIVKDNDAALEALAPLVDAFLLHDRPIHVPCDDSVMRIHHGRELPIRRSRGYAPFPIKLPHELRPTLAVGGELKSTFCLTNGTHAFLSQHIGDMQNLETLHAFERSVAHMQTLFQIEPELIACDMHPRYLSSRWAQKQRTDAQEDDSTEQIEIVQVQHHHAHIASVMAENGLDGSSPVIGFAFDGTGYGPDGTIWGGEVLIADYGTFQRAAHLKPFPLAGGDASVKRPYRTALACLWAADLPWSEALPPVAACPVAERKILLRQIERNLNTVLTSSMGRLFDAVAALIGVRQTVTYEAQAAIELEALADSMLLSAQKSGHSPPEKFCPISASEDVVQNFSGQIYEFQIVPPTEPDLPLQFDPSDLLAALTADLSNNVAATQIATKFHHAVAKLVLDLSLHLRAETGLNIVALSGGVFQNVLLLEQIEERLQAHAFNVLTHRLLPPNDGGLVLGQAMIANFCSREKAIGSEEINDSAAKKNEN